MHQLEGKLLKWGTCCADLEAMVYNIGASKSPVTQAAKAARGLLDRFSK